MYNVSMKFLLFYIEQLQLFCFHSFISCQLTGCSCSKHTKILIIRCFCRYLTSSVHTKCEDLIISEISTSGSIGQRRRRVACNGTLVRQKRPLSTLRYILHQNSVEARLEIVFPHQPKLLTKFPILGSVNTM